MRILHPRTVIVALEPGPETFTFLQKNAKKYDFIAINKAIGTKAPTCYIQDYYHGRSYCMENTEKDHVEVPTITFHDLFGESGCALKHKYFLKIDCEGGEKYILTNENKKVLRNAAQISMEIHFDAHNRKTFGKNWPEFSLYNKWIYNNLSDVFKTEYYASRRHRGLGHYCMINKSHISKKNHESFNDWFERIIL